MEPTAYVVTALLGVRMASLEPVPLARCEEMRGADPIVICVVVEPDCGGSAPACLGRADLEPKPKARTVRRRR